MTSTFTAYEFVIQLTNSLTSGLADEFTNGLINGLINVLINVLPIEPLQVLLRFIIDQHFLSIQHSLFQVHF